MKQYILIIFILIFTFSCSSKKNIIYLQGSEEIFNKIEYAENRIRVDDILKITLNSEFQETIVEFKSSDAISSSKDVYLLNGYQVNSDGYISFPKLGSIYVLGKTITQLKSELTSMLTDGGYFNDIHMDIKILNSYFTILGEVNRPGKYDFLENNINIFEAIGIGGDLTINGKRNDIKIIRNIGENTTVKTIDLTKDSIFNNTYFQIFPGDIIIVNPNTTRIKNAGIIGNSGTLISLLSFLISSFIVLGNN